MLKLRNKILERIHPMVKLLSLVLIVLSLFIAKSVYLILSITTFMIIIYTFFDENIFCYVKFLKNRIIFLLILVIFYILIIDKCVIADLVLLFYKFVLTNFVIYNYELGVNFDQLHESIYGIIRPVRKKRANESSYNLTMALYIVKAWFDSKEIVKSNKILKGKGQGILTSRSIIITRLAKSKQLNLKLNYYRLKYRKTDFKSKICLICFMLFFIICLFKEVIY